MDYARNKIINTSCHGRGNSGQGKQLLFVSGGGDVNDESGGGKEDAKED